MVNAKTIVALNIVIIYLYIYVYIYSSWFNSDHQTDYQHDHQTLAALLTVAMIAIISIGIIMFNGIIIMCIINMFAMHAPSNLDCAQYIDR